MIWTYPERKLFIDGRLPQYQFGEHSILEEYYNFFEEGKSEAKLKQYNIQLVFLRKNLPIKFNSFEKYILGMNEDAVNDKENHMIKFLENSNTWTKIYSDNISYIYVKK